MKDKHMQAARGTGRAHAPVGRVRERRLRPAMASISKSSALCALCLVGNGAGESSTPMTAQAPVEQAAASTLEETRLVMGKWIETQQIVSKERNEWQQAKEILVGRLELVKREISALEEKIRQAQTTVAETNAKRDELLAQDKLLAANAEQLQTAVTRLEGEVRRLFPALPEPIQTKLQPLRQRLPEPDAETRASVAERFQNVLGILSEINKANTEIAVNYEVHTLADGKPSEVKALYVGLAQAYYVSAGGQAGIGRPSATGWTWEPSREVANDVLTALEIMQGTQPPAFVALPVKLQ